MKTSAEKSATDKKQSKISTKTMDKSNYAKISTSDTGKPSVITFDGKDVTKDIKSVQLDRAIKEKELYMFKHPRTGQWTREIHLKSYMHEDIEAYTSTAPASGEVNTKKVKAINSVKIPIAKATAEA